MAPRARVWDVLLRPESVMRIMPVTEVVSAWRPASPFAWRFEMLGEVREIVGAVLRFEVGRLLEYDYLDPLTAKPHRVTIELTDEGTATRVSVIQDNNLSVAAQAHAEGGWRLSLNNFKVLVEAAGPSTSMAG